MDVIIEEETRKCPTAMPTMGSLLVMFGLFIIVLSDYFINNTIGMLGGKMMSGRTPSTAGYAVLGLALVMMHAGVTYLMAKDIL